MHLYFYISFISKTLDPKEMLQTHISSSGTVYWYSKNNRVEWQLWQPEHEVNWLIDIWVTECYAWMTK